MNCQKCEARSAFNDGPCNDCKVKSASASIPKENTNTKPAYTTIHEYLFGKDR